ncbi:uncharacterized protein LOC124161445 [Ischnura elegans]|uniref:uncharacterized protein LOC124161445 n=1 Tax=Ischnura elegans TaxID=197161 RepID=UPI001ED8A0DB|nr:uncharacterized protein LOC124161445 [Ischnura elegans]
MAANRRSKTLFLLTVTAFTTCVLFTVTGGSEANAGYCELKTNTSRRWSFTLTRFHNESGQWVEFTSTREMDDESAVQLTEHIFECGGRKMIRLQGTLKDPFSNEIFGHQLKFHHMSGPNTALINKGYTVVKLKLDRNGHVLTNRSLRPGELFEIRLDKRGTTKGAANGIGVTTHKPGSDAILKPMSSMAELKVGVSGGCHDESMSEGLG